VRINIRQFGYYTANLLINLWHDQPVSKKEVERSGFTTFMIPSHPIITQRLLPVL